MEQFKFNVYLKKRIYPLIHYGFTYPGGRKQEWKKEQRGGKWEGEEGKKRTK